MDVDDGTKRMRIKSNTTENVLDRFIRTPTHSTRVHQLLIFSGNPFTVTVFVHPPPPTKDKIVYIFLQTNKEQHNILDVMRVFMIGYERYPREIQTIFKTKRIGYNVLNSN